MMRRLRALLALAALMLFAATPAFAQQPMNVAEVLGAPISASNPLFTCLVSLGGSQCITIPGSQTQNFDTDGGTDVTEIFGIAVPDPAGAVAVDGNHPLPVITTASSVISAVGNVAHDFPASGPPVTVGITGIALGSNPTNVTAGDVSRLYGNMAGIPFSGIAHPNIITREWTVADADGAQTGTALVDISAGTKIVVLFAKVTCDADNSVAVNYRMAFDTDATFAAAATTGTSGIIDSQAGIPAGGGSITTRESIGGDGEDVRYSLEDPVGGSCRGIVKYYTIAP